MKKFILFSAVVGITALFLCNTPYSNANMIVYFDDVVTQGIDVIIVDNNDGGVGTMTPLGPSNTPDGDARVDKIGFTGMVGSWTVGESRFLSPLYGGYITQLSMGIEHLNSGLESNELVLGLTDTGFSLNDRGMHLRLVSGMYTQDTTVGEFVSQGFLDPLNAEFGDTFQTPEVRRSQPTSPYGSGSYVDILPKFDNYQKFSMSEMIKITHSDPGKTRFLSGGNTVHAVPEASTILLFGVGLIGLVGWGRKKFKKNK